MYYKKGTLVVSDFVLANDVQRTFSTTHNVFKRTVDQQTYYYLILSSRICILHI